MKKIILSLTVLLALTVGFGLGNSLTDKEDSKNLLQLNIASVAYAEEGDLPCKYGTTGNILTDPGSGQLYCPTCSYKWMTKITSSGHCNNPPPN
jgi:hypothetical protein